MNLKFFGDSYDIVKQSLLRWLEPCGAWKAHPMFTPPVDQESTGEFEQFVGVDLVSKEAISRRRAGENFIDQAKKCQSHLFLDPDTGLRLKSDGATRKHLLARELVEIAKARPDKLTLVFDQSFSRSSPRMEQIQKKLSHLAGHGVYGVTYNSQACFTLVSADKQVLDGAVRTLLKESRLPAHRLVRAPDKAKADSV